MGQQQLLLLVLGIVIVGLAVVVGIQAFGENQKKANADAMTNDAIRIASDAQAWSLKPSAFGGGDGKIAGVTLAKLGYTASGTGAAAVYTNLNADPASTGTGSGYVLTPAAGKLTIVGTNINSSNFVRTEVYGTGPGCIVTQVGSALPTATTAVPAGCTQYAG